MRQAVFPSLPLSLQIKYIFFKSQNILAAGGGEKKSQTSLDEDFFLRKDILSDACCTVDEP